MTAAPAYLTKRNPALASDGAAVAVMAETLGTPLMPWQRAVLDVATEHHPTIPGAWRYPVVVLTIPRQSGKTTILRALMAHRALMNSGMRCFYTAQTGKDARERWRDLVTAIDGGPLASYVTVRRSQGSEALTFTNSGSTISPFAPTPKAMHGYTPHLVCVDECFAFDSAQGADLMGAIVPAQQTLDSRQLWLVSTAGDSRSAFLREWVERGRAATRDTDASVCYAEWSCPEDTDPYDPEQWEAWHPALGITATPRAMRDAASTLPRGEFLRAMANQWTTAAEAVVPAEDMAACLTQQTPPDPGQVALAYDVALDRSAAAIWAAWTDDDGRACVHPWLAQAGTGWLIDALRQAADAGYPLWADDGGSTRAITDAATLAGLSVSTIGARDMAAATGNLIDAALTHRLSRTADDGLDTAMEGAAIRRVSGAPLWDRQASTGQIHHIVAATAALWGSQHRRQFWTLP